MKRDQRVRWIVVGLIVAAALLAWLSVFSSQRAPVFLSTDLILAAAQGDEGGQEPPEDPESEGEPASDNEHPDEDSPPPDAANDGPEGANDESDLGDADDGEGDTLSGDTLELEDESSEPDPDALVVVLDQESVEALASIIGRSTAVPALGLGVVALMLSALLVQGVFKR